MSLKEKTRANTFDRWMGVKQTQLSMKLGTGTSILDIGCGVCEFTPMFKERFRDVVGLDMDEKMITEAIQNTQGVGFILGDASKFSTKARFDTISMNNLLEHVEDPVAVLRNCEKHLSKG